MKDERDIAVVPYVCYDALMERFERAQKNLRLCLIFSMVVSVCLILSLICR